MSIINVLRWVHILAGAAWLGEVVAVNFVLVPVLANLEPGKRSWFLAAIFPRVYRLASALSLTTVLAGVSLNLSMNDWHVDAAIVRLTSSRWGWSILIGGSLGLGLTLFHFFAEHRLEPHVLATQEDPDGEAFVMVLRSLRIIPRVGLIVLLAIFLLMMVAARGL